VPHESEPFKRSIVGPSGVSACMRKPSCALIFFVLVIFSLALAVPAEDVPETTFDESETQPYEGSSLFAIAVVQASTRTTQEALSYSGLKLSVLSLSAVARFHDTFANRSSGARVSSALLCTRRC